jgi:hypothetical protein
MDVLAPAVAVAVQRVRDMRVCPDPAHLLIDVLAKVGHIKDATPIEGGAHKAGLL